ncbi:alpha/beta fold hydrolase [Gordonia pseudamarae]|jgi:esterase|uniref:Alpha/beta fold hydrolase n=1 Tax=Gordonia pseudamarae TaxID=2831662 RepID=A0ABX6IMG4_9ACTN|nr:MULTISPECIES: alpha/beta fold hydrolase [Gordonia]MBD0021133.1 alpha/beta fold hydrolase [Gordonia sp. (in: high G+C Gram-positive bacteria)]QHN27505.1 alpha/beta fold hydrolase [Gordonia pseudamarae]QHN36388.1 alpha/beta fold hydrolase [Gordonia pseudamarae]
MRTVSGADGTTLAVRTSGPLGSGTTPVLLVHGMGSDHSTWRSTAALLRAAGRPVIASDLRGHGRSEHTTDYGLGTFADDLRAVIDALGVGQVDVIGHSLGAHAALRLAMDHPARVRSLVLEEVPPMPRDDADLAEEITMGAGLGERVRGVAALLRNPLPVLRSDRAVGEAVQRQFAAADPYWWDRLARVRSPALIVSGGSRSFLRPDHLRALAASLPGSDFTTIDIGHSVHRDAGTEFNSAVATFLGIGRS